MKLSILLTVTAITIGLMTSIASAASFGAGDVAVYRVGNGTAVIGTDPAPVFIDEYSPAGVLVQSIAMPTIDSGTNHALDAQGSATLEGLIKRSTNGQFLLLTGYDHTPGVAVPPSVGNGTLAQTSGAEVSRTIGRIDAAGNINTSTTVNDSGQGSPRSAISDNGTNLWLSHGSVGSDATPDGGIRFTTLGTTGSSTFVSSVSPDPRAINIFNSQLYFTAQTADTASTPPSPVAAVGLGTPTTTGQTVSGLPGVVAGSGPNIVDFFLADLDAGVAGLDTLYITGDGTAALTKYSLVSGTWTSNGTVGTNANDYRGLTATVSGATVTLYATLANGAGDDTLVRVVDSSGYNAALTGTATLVATAGANTQFKGVSFVPVAPTLVAGDYNGNGTVDAADYVVWRKNSGLTGGASISQGNGDGDSDVDNDDYVYWRSRFGNNTPGGGSALGAANVPEPTTMLMLPMAAVALLVVSRPRVMVMRHKQVQPTLIR